jgi:site-specific DNA-methyltransferase (adenine-specific)/adenine-specific DNA-methyltransferase
MGLSTILDAPGNVEATKELSAIMGPKTFAFPKPSDLVALLVGQATKPGDLVMDSFAGSGTTAHAVSKLNAANATQAQRQYILVELDSGIARKTTSQRIRRVTQGYTNARGETVAGLGGGFRYVQLGEPLFEASGKIRSTVRYRDLARHVFFTETGTPLPHDAPCDQPLLGDAHGTGVYLLYNGILKDKSPGGGNVLTQPILDGLPPHDGPKVIYGTACRIGPQRLKTLGITFKQTPYAIKVR